MDHDKYWTLEQAAEALRASIPTIKRWIYAGQLPAAKIGRRWLIPRETVDAMLTRGAITRSPALIHSLLLDGYGQHELDAMASLIMTTLRAGGWPHAQLPIDADGVKKVLRDEEKPTPVFWRYLVRGIERLHVSERGRFLARDAGEPPTKQQNPFVLPSDRKLVLGTPLAERVRRGRRPKSHK